MAKENSPKIGKTSNEILKGAPSIVAILTKMENMANFAKDVAKRLGVERGAFNIGDFDKNGKYGNVTKMSNPAQQTIGIGLVNILRWRVSILTKMENLAKNTKNDIGFAPRLTCEATFYQIQLNQIYQKTVQSMEVVPIMYFLP